MERTVASGAALNILNAVRLGLGPRDCSEPAALALAHRDDIGDRAFVILPHTAHSIGYSNNRHLMWYAVRNFLQAPPAVSA
jgi:hypothetical protein